jgi:hypothetical protein
MEHDALSVSMFWAGALMAFAPLVFAAAVLGVWWYGRRRDAERHRTEERQSASASAQPRGSTTRPR